MTDHTAIQETDEMKQQWAKHIKQGASMTDREAMKLALEALEEYCITRTITRPIASSDALRQALAQPEQEPVTWAETNDLVCALLRQAHDVLATASYPMRRPWVGLTDDEIEHLRNDQPWWMVRDIEAKLKEKNGGAI